MPGTRKLTDKHVRELRTRYVVNNERLTVLSAEFGISPGHAWHIVTGDERAAAGGPLHEPRTGRKPGYRNMSGEQNPNSRLTAEDCDLIRSLVAQGGTRRAVAGVMMCSPSTVTRIVNQLPDDCGN